MARARKPMDLGLELIVAHPESEVDRRPGLIPDYEVDANGHEVKYQVLPMGGDAICWLTLRRGLSPVDVSKLLRTLADTIDTHGKYLLNLPRGECGYFDCDGMPVRSCLCVEYDPTGNIPIIPELL